MRDQATSMLDRQLKSVPPNRSSLDAAPAAVEIGLRDIIAFLRRRRWSIVLSVVVALFLGVAYLVTAPAEYTATTVLMIDTSKLSIFSQGDVIGEAVVSNSSVETQVQVLLSERVAEAVAKKLDLMHNSAFMARDDGPIGAVADLVHGLISRIRGSSTSSVVAAPPDEETLTQIASSILRSNVQAQRVGLSFVIAVSYDSPDPLLSAKIANAYTDAYVEDQFNAQVATAQRAADWLQSRIQDLNRQSMQENVSAQEKSAIRTTYDAFLQRYTQAVQQQSLPLSEARVITAAVRGAKMSPRSSLVMVASLILGGMLGLGIAVARDLLDGALRTRRQVQAAAPAPFLGYLPKFDIGGFTMRRIARRSRKLLDPVGHKFAAGPAYSVVLTAPFSRFAETLRNVKVAADQVAAEPARVIGIISPLANEGRTTVAINLARLVAQSGGRVLLIDGDLRNPQLSKNLAAENAPGLVQLVRDQAQIGDLIWADQATKVDFLPAGAEAKLVNANEILSSPATQALLEAARRQYSLVIVDLPAVLPVLIHSNV